MLVVERRRDDLEPVVVGGLAALVQFADRSVNDSVQCLGGGHDAAPEIGVLLTEAAHFVKADFDLLSILAANIAERSGVEDNGLEALDVAFLNGAEHRVGIEDAPGHELAVGAQRCGAEIDDPGGRKLRS